MTFLQKMDNYFSGKKPSEKWMAAALIALVTGYFIYIFVNEPINKFYNRSVEEKKSLQNKIASYETFLDNISINGDEDFNIKRLDKELQKLRKENNVKRNQLRKLDSDLRKVSEMLYTKNNWSQFLHSISSRAKDDGVKITTLENRAVDNNKSFGHVLEIGIRCKGEYGKTLAFMHDLEQSSLVTDIYKSKIVSKDGIANAEINLSVWGVKP